MLEGWLDDDYIILFEEQSSTLHEAYALPDFLPDYQLVGLCGWDDFIVKNNHGILFTVPTVPLSTVHLRPLEKDLNPADLVADEGKVGQIKWYTKPVCFGGDPSLGPNLQWVSLELHTQLVKWWNQKYRQLIADVGPPAV
jgi:hypothetical protein